MTCRGCVAWRFFDAASYEAERGPTAPRPTLPATLTPGPWPVRSVPGRADC